MSRQSHEQLSPAQLENVANLFGVLADPTRLAILQRLRQSPASVSGLMTDLGLKQANASKHLAVLHRAGIVARQAQGTSVIYNVSDRRVFDLCKIVCDQLRQQAAEKATIFKRRAAYR